MAEQISNYQCPACTGPLHFDGKLGKLKCDYCGSTYTVEEVKEFYDSKNKAAAEAEQAETAAQSTGSAAADPMEASTDWGVDAVHMRAYNCTKCGAELIPGSRFCENCGTKNTPRFCENCGATLREGAKFCESCGAKL